MSARLLHRSVEHTRDFIESFLLFNNAPGGKVLRKMASKRENGTGNDGGKL